MAQDTAVITVIGIGADGVDGLSMRSRRELQHASVIFGSLRQLELLAEESLAAECRVWPSPLLPALPTMFDGLGNVHVLASGDPMLHGIGTTLIRLFGADRVHVLPHVSSVSLACARMGWAVNDVEIISLVNAPATSALRFGGRAIVLSRNADTPAELAQTLTDSGLGDSRLTVWEQLGGAAEKSLEGVARDWGHSPGHALNVVAVEYFPTAAGEVALPLVAGLSEDAFEHDGQITKREIRAVTLASLAPRPGQRLWDVGAGSGSIAIEWSRSGTGCSASAFEIKPSRRAAIVANATKFGVDVECFAAAPCDFDRACPPDAIFVGGGVTNAGLLEACWERLPSGGRIVVNAVTAESEALLLRWYSRHGGELHRYRVEDAAPLGAFTSWRSRLPVAQWTGEKS
ncbi:precorrin-6y C5,15-methyltransferase (decarboxylating) subunit CbiE [Mycobacteroides chelonae]|uniref:Cobalamin biosynthesis bifunctional protein CbiET n=1 Tax=Mycobacteroides chelonae TaxID=1774 RepID=A0A1S1M1I8_MYCCH|nr:precorrin-6y C5,15-methyltransferase (decarboxylating) subunit CbiE [Mycobacteroides chelonae]OHU77186.1 cobalamin biosynthesis bifunctional protein CbiET [Mycobacteroides chelonae]QQG87680.1 precorrin-6y C5,15-methyltransferase (decarboxylating) subunit CbiE [Mycobacteroides chelonae]QQG92496.1 precorrin-6y C5,15-methyltransferase (decarboxylating) subunit CbiE [Mycobacteroides chelonae]